MEDRITFRVSEEDARTLNDASKKDGRSISSFVRFYSLQKASEVLEDGNAL